MQTVPERSSEWIDLRLPEEPSLASAREASRRRAWLASLLMRREMPALRRLAFTFERLRRAPRPWRRRLQRQLAATLTGAALLLALTNAPAGADTTSTISVFSGEVNIAANGRCSLREAIINANNGAQTHADCAAGSAGADTINLPGNGDFPITNSAGTWYGSATGLPLITSDITINGNLSKIHRSATTPFRLMAVADLGSLELTYTTLTNGFSSARGGALYSAGGDIALFGCTISGNHASFGGGVANSVPYDLGDLDGPGGMTRIEYSSFRDNDATGSGGALWLSSEDAIASSAYTSAVIYASQFEGNSATRHGGALYNYGHNPLIMYSSIEGNTANDDGGGMYSFYGDVTVLGSTISDNTADGNGGGLFFMDTFSNITNSTISGNEATGVAGAGPQYGLGGGIYHTSQELTLTNSTIIENRAEEGGGIYTYQDTTLRRNLISGNTANVGPEVSAQNAPSIVSSHNLFGHSNNSGVAGFAVGGTNIVPSVKPLAIRDSLLGWNGGWVKTHALVANSPALDVAPNTDCNAGPVFGVDQRGLPRNQNGKGGASANECDIGSFEAQSVPPPPPKLYVAPTAAGNVSGIAATPQDILVFDLATETWAMHFDGGDVGITKALSAFSQMPNDDDLLLSFKVNVTLPGVGTVTPWDVVRFVPTSLGNNTTGSFQWHIDGSDVGLSAASEKIDAIDALPDGRVLVSTSGALSAPKQGGGTLKSQDEDLSALHATSFGANTAGAWSIYFNPTAIPGMKAEDVASAAVDANSGTVFVAFDSAFNVDGVSGDAKDVVRFTPVYGGWKVQRIWRGPSNGFNLNLAGVERQ